jgi:branched-subunit amino acid ABC-type transport system permease component
VVEQDLTRAMAFPAADLHGRGRARTGRRACGPDPTQITDAYFGIHKTAEAPMFEALIQGILLGGYYAVLAAGLSLMFGVVRFINLAHGDMAVLGALIALWLVQGRGAGCRFAIALTLPAMAAFGWLMQRLIFERALAGGFLIPILTTIGLGAALQNGMFGIFGSTPGRSARISAGCPGPVGSFRGGSFWASCRSICS